MTDIDRILFKLDDLCDRMARVEENLSNHLQNQERKFNKTTIILSIVVAIIAVTTALR